MRILAPDAAGVQLFGFAQQEIGQGAHAQTGRAGRPLIHRAFAVGGGAVDVQPALLVILDEVRQEGRR